MNEGRQKDYILDESTYVKLMYKDRKQSSGCLGMMRQQREARIIKA